MDRPPRTHDAAVLRPDWTEIVVGLAVWAILIIAIRKGTDTLTERHIRSTTRSVLHYLLRATDHPHPTAPSPTSPNSAGTTSTARSPASTSPR